MKSVGDISLVARVVAFGDKRAFDALVKRHQAAVRRFFMSQTLGDGLLSDDLAQDTFVKAYTHIGSFRGTSGFSTWLFRIACNVLYDYMRSRKTTDGIDDGMFNRSGGVADNALKIDIYAALRLLKPDERLCVTLQLVDGQPIGRIAEITGMPTGTVKSHLARGKSKLAEYLKENGYDR